MRTTTRHKTKSHEEIKFDGYSILKGGERYPYVHYQKDHAMKFTQSLSNNYEGAIIQYQRRTLQRLNTNSFQKIYFSNEVENFLNQYSDPNNFEKQMNTNKIYRDIVNNLNSSVESLKAVKMAEIIENTRQMKELFTNNTKTKESEDTIVKILMSIAEAYKLINEADAAAMIVLLQDSIKDGGLKTFFNNLQLNVNELNNKQLTFSEQILSNTYSQILNFLSSYLKLNGEKKEFTSNKLDSYISNIMNREMGEGLIGLVLHNVYGEALKELRNTGKDKKNCDYEDNFGNIVTEKITYKADIKGLLSLTIKSPDGKNVDVAIDLGVSSKFKNKKYTTQPSALTTIESGIPSRRIRALFSQWSDQVLLLTAYSYEDGNEARQLVERYIMARLGDSFLAGGRGGTQDLAQIFVVNGHFYYAYDILQQLFLNDYLYKIKPTKTTEWIQKSYTSAKPNWITAFNRNKRISQYFDSKNFDVFIKMSQIKSY